ncbi:hypothetical protein MIND_00789700 [Mycena indigotica]|uniref:DUF6534 domain-containing protein n=1 Tax=Mycena indigotica TaxID=2126181 RepID=A0A8H6SNV8_9AGAR|nr:uncharacterized protein MIND_00789700 [Mycena indigotica]KAF7302227.1 hypothetical protein MIND_00789700 [Mycena indigotica]
MFIRRPCECIASPPLYSSIPSSPSRCPPQSKCAMVQFELFTAPILAGTQANWLLLGTLAVQVYKFHVTFPNERWWLRALVFTLFTLEIVQTAITSHFAYSLLVINWGQPEIFAKLPWSSLAVPIFTGITSASVQIFYAWRIHALKGARLWARFVCVVIIMLALMQSLAAFITDARFAITTQLSELASLMIGVKVWLIGSAACDIVITVTLLGILTEYRRNTPWKRMDGLLAKLIYNTIETGAITTFVAVADVILFILLPQTNLHQTPALMLGKLYTNVLLTTLNARAGIDNGPRSGGQSGSNGGAAMVNLNETRAAGAAARQASSEVQWRRYGGAPDSGDLEAGFNSSRSTQQPSHKVHITTSTHVMRDVEPEDDEEYKVGGL